MPVRSQMSRFAPWDRNRPGAFLQKAALKPVFLSAAANADTGSQQPSAPSTSGRRLRAWRWSLLLALTGFPVQAAHAQATLQEKPSAAVVFEKVCDRVRQSYQGLEPAACRELPIGLFDSGTGGLTVLEQILGLDAFDNATHAPRAGGDGRPDFEWEQFVFLADQANMPYGHYASVGKAEFLRELVLKDAEFLMLAEQRAANRCPLAPGEGPSEPAKAVVIACNTATAHGEHLIRKLIRDAGAPVFLLGVIEAGAEGALESLPEGQGGTIGVLATCGTVSAGAYPATIQRLAQARHPRAAVQVVQQGSLGLAGAIDGVADFIAPTAKGVRSGYRGPGFDNTEAPIARECLPRMAFDFSGGAMLCQGDPGNPTALQINSVANYVAYDVTLLLESVRRAAPAEPLRAVILGCTHFPYFADAFRHQLRRLYDYQEEGRYVYRPWMAEHVAVIDPAQFAAKQLYRALARDRRLSPPRALNRARGEFFITVPNRAWPGAALSEGGWFTHDYKYGRVPGLDGADVRRVPLTPRWLEPSAWERLRREVPRTFALLERSP